MGDTDVGSGHNGRPEGLPQSMFAPYKQLPVEGEVILSADAACDPEVSRCRTPIYTYESKCTCCSGTGFTKNQANGRRASLHTCIMCLGLGYVRRTTARFVPATGPDAPTLGRPERPQPKKRPNPMQSP